MTALLKLDLATLNEFEVISHLDYYLARNMASVFKEKDSLVLAACALVSRALSRGRICLNLKDISREDLRITKDPDLSFAIPSQAEWNQALDSSRMVWQPGAMSYKEGGLPSRPGPDRPLVLDKGGNLYLARYYDFQVRLSYNLKKRIKTPCSSLDASFVKSRLDIEFSGQVPAHVARQKEAVLKALTHNFVVISGGPGTGKTHLINIIRRLLDEYADSMGSKRPGIISMAPTGKAASRMTCGATIHSVLKPQSKGTGFHYNGQNLLGADVVIVDEASMIDLALMTRLFEAISPETKLILLGDKNQLSPVQAGAVFSDICRIEGLEDYRTILEFNFRSKGQTGLENLSLAINANDSKSLAAILTGVTYPDIEFEDMGNDRDRCPVLERYIAEGYAYLNKIKSLEQGFGVLDKFRVLCAHNRGNSGTLSINHLCEKILRQGFNSGIREPFFNQIVMVRGNDYQKGLFNGDTGIVYNSDSGPRAGFEADGGRVRNFRYQDLPAHDPGFAITIHKSQGSEFDTVLIIIPERLSPVVTRQLLYTGVTRARKKAVIVGSLEVITAAMDLENKHGSSLAEMLEQMLTHPDD